LKAYRLKLKNYPVYFQGRKGYRSQLSLVGRVYTSKPSTSWGARKFRLYSSDKAAACFPHYTSGTMELTFTADDWEVIECKVIDIKEAN